MSPLEIARREEALSAVSGGSHPHVSIVVSIADGHAGAIERLGAATAAHDLTTEHLVVCTPSMPESLRTLVMRKGMRLVVAPHGTPASELPQIGLRNATGNVVLLVNEHESLEERRADAQRLVSLAQIATPHVHRSSR